MMSPQDFSGLATLARTRSGVVLGEERAFFAEGRLAALARREGDPSVADLMARLRRGDDDALARAVVEAVTVTETAFFRDRGVFAALADHVLPALAKPGVRPRVLSMGCATGQEAYSIAMMAEDAAVSPAGLDLVGADLSTAALARASAGAYTHFEVQRGLPVRRLLRHFQPLDDSWLISGRMRQSVRWRRMNLVEDFSVRTPFDLVLCRYVLDGFDPALRGAALGRAAACVRPGGWLVLGLGEAPPPGFVMDGAPGLYRREAQEELAA